MKRTITHRLWRRLDILVARLSQWTEERANQALLRDSRYIDSLPMVETVGPPLRGMTINGTPAVWDAEHKVWTTASGTVTWTNPFPNWNAA